MTSDSRSALFDTWLPVYVGSVKGLQLFQKENNWQSEPPTIMSLFHLKKSVNDQAPLFYWCSKGINTCSKVINTYYCVFLLPIKGLNLLSVDHEFHTRALHAVTDGRLTSLSPFFLGNKEKYGTSIHVLLNGYHSALLVNHYNIFDGNALWANKMYICLGRKYVGFRMRSLMFFVLVNSKGVHI